MVYYCPLRIILVKVAGGEWPKKSGVVYPQSDVIEWYQV
jgi:hypothetical protein